MEAKGSAKVAAADAAKKKKKMSTTRVKVVASRYAQALQTKNIEAHAHVRARASSTAAAAPPSAAGSDASAAKPAGRSKFASTSAAVRAKTPTPHSVRAKSDPQVVAPAAAEMTPTDIRASADSGSMASESTGQDIRERLKAYKASKALATQNQPSKSPSASARSSTTTAAATASVAKPIRSAKSPTSRERPIFPKRITTTERSSKRPAKIASEPIPVETTVLARPTSASSATTPRVRVSSSSSAPIATAASAARGAQNEEEELELLQAMYYQLCFTERRAEETFRRQEEAAEKQMIAAWNVFQSKLQLLHDTSLRLDREKHIQSTEENLGDQAILFVQVASRLPVFVESLSQVCTSLESSLHRLPTPGIRCSPSEVKRHLDALTVELDGLLHQLQVANLDTEISSAVSFERGMDQVVDKIGASLLQIANLVEDVLQEVSTETSMAIQQIQHQRLEASMARDDWW